MSKYKCKFQKQIDTEKVCEAFEANRYGDIICQEEDCQLCKLKAENERLREENYGLNQELLGYKKGVQASEIIELKQTLQEIKEIAKRKITKNRYGLEQKIFEIIQKITKAEKG